jgi:hypothetical protein
MIILKMEQCVMVSHDDWSIAFMIALYCGHEGEIYDRQQGIKRDGGEGGEPNEFVVKDRNGVVQLKTTSQHEAETRSKNIIGSQIVRKSSATADLVRMQRNKDGQLEKKSIKIPADFQNTAYSPIHDAEGSAHKLHYEENKYEEEINSEMIAEYEEQQEEIENDPNAWMYL